MILQRFLLIKRIQHKGGENMILELLGALFGTFCILGICVYVIELLMLFKMMKR